MRVARCGTCSTARGSQAVAFHANGTGGATLERLVGEGRFGAVLDVTTTELADLVAGGTLVRGREPADGGRPGRACRRWSSRAPSTP